MFSKLLKILKENKGTVGSVLGFVGGLVASKAPLVADLLNAAAKALGAQ